MRKLDVFIEINGIQIHAGTIKGDNPDNAIFAYAPEYVEKKYPSLSISLPVEKNDFSPEDTRNFFEGLLPEGFARKSVAKGIHAEEEDYLTVLEVLGAECLGAIRVGDEAESGSYVELTMDEVKSLAREGVSKSTEMITEAHLSLTGASGKVGLYYDESEDVWYKPIGSAPSTHIVKQSHVRLSGIVTNEQLSLVTAEKLGIDIPESFIINVGHGGDEDVLFATKRYDRILKNNHFGQGISRPLRLHQEDFAQALGIAAADKYEKSGQNYLSKIFNLIRNNASNPINDQLKMWDIIVYDFFVGNTDNHIKNISLLYSYDLRSISLAPAYDIVSTAIYEGSSREMAIGIGGERVIDNIGEKHFIDAASEIGLSKKIAMGRFDKIANEFESAINEACKRMENEGYQDVRKIKEMILRKGGFGHM